MEQLTEGHVEEASAAVMAAVPSECPTKSASLRTARMWLCVCGHPAHHARQQPVVADGSWPGAGIGERQVRSSSVPSGTCVWGIAWSWMPA